MSAVFRALRAELTQFAREHWSLATLTVAIPCLVLLWPL